MDVETFTKKALDEIAARALQHEPLNNNFTSKDLELIYSLAYAQYENKEFQEANDLFQKLCVFSPMKKHYWIGLASTYRMLKQYEHALIGWAMAAILDDSDPSVHFQAAICHFHLDQKSEATKAIKEANSRLNPEDTLLKEEITLLETKLLSGEGV